MTPEVLQSKLSDVYRSYSDVIKLLIADIEARYEEFPPAVFNEIRALHDHIARCYSEGVTDDQIEDNIKKAEGHINRLILDCFKYLILFLSDKVKRFEKQYQNIDLSTIQDGDFYIQYKKLSREAVLTVRDAKTIEGTNKIEALSKFEKAYNIYYDLETLLYENDVHLHRAKCRYTTRYILKCLLWLLTAVLSGLISIIFSCEDVKNLVEKLFQ